MRGVGRVWQRKILSGVDGTCRKSIRWHVYENGALQRGTKTEPVSLQPRSERIEGVGGWGGWGGVVRWDCRAERLSLARSPLTPRL